MNQTAEQIREHWGDTLIKIKTTSGDVWIGTIEYTAGIVVGNSPVAQASQLGFNAISDLAAYKKGGIEYKPEHRIIDPKNIESIREYDLLNRPVNLSYTDYQNITMGDNPIFASQIIDEIKEGKTYQVKHEGATFEIVLNNDGNMTLSPI